MQVESCPRLPADAPGVTSRPVQSSKAKAAPKNKPKTASKPGSPKPASPPQSPPGPQPTLSPQPPSVPQEDPHKASSKPSKLPVRRKKMEVPPSTRTLRARKPVQK